MTRFKGYNFLMGPEQLLLEPPNRRVQTISEYRLWHGHHVMMRGGNPWDSHETINAYVNHGRWVAVCRWCETGMFTRPDWAVAYCTGCGARYEGGHRIRFPLYHSEVTRLLCLRIRRDQQNWDNTQSLEELRAENGVIMEAGGVV